MHLQQFRKRRGYQKTERVASVERKQGIEPRTGEEEEEPKTTRQTTKE
jgi:hypothetical protein